MVTIIYLYIYIDDHNSSKSKNGVFKKKYDKSKGYFIVSGKRNIENKKYLSWFYGFYFLLLDNYMMVTVDVWMILKVHKTNLGIYGIPLSSSYLWV